MMFGVLLAASSAFAAPAGAATGSPADVQRGLDQLVRAKGGPPGAIATIYRDGKLTVLRSGRSNVNAPTPPRPAEHMRIASVAKAFSGAAALHLVATGKLGLDQTIAQLLSGMPAAWGDVTVRQMLDHTSGLPDYSESKGFHEQLTDDPGGFVSTKTIIDWVRAKPLEFAPGSDYRYSNTDNIVVGLIVEAVSGRTYARELEDDVFIPAQLRQTSLPKTVGLRSPFIHGYVLGAGGKPEDVSTLINPSGAWASGGIVSTPRDLNKFIRAYLGLKFFSAAEQRQQMQFVPGGESSPPGPGANSAGLALFRYRTKCGTVYGHTGNFPGYTQWAAANADGSRGVTMSLNIPAPTGKLLARLRGLQTTAVCALLGR